MNCQPKEGYELWRSFAREYEPQIGSRSASLLVQTLHRKFDLGDVHSSLEKLENLIKRYDGTVAKGEECEDRDIARTDSQTTPSGTRAGECITSQEAPRHEAGNPI
eukprot:3138495-Amphidinium_carterae.1